MQIKRPPDWEVLPTAQQNGLPNLMPATSHSAISPLKEEFIAKEDIQNNGTRLELHPILHAIQSGLHTFYHGLGDVARLSRGSASNPQKRYAC